MAAPTLYLYCNVERIWAYPGLFALNFSIALDVTSASGLKKRDLQPLMRPWEWNWTAVVIWPRRTGWDTAAIVTTLPVLQDRAGLIAAYDAFLDSMAFNGDDPNNSFFQRVNTSAPLGECEPRLSVVTGDMTTRPAPLQQNLGFSRYFRLPNATGGWPDSTDWFAAPVFQGSPLAAGSGSAAPVNTGPITPSAWQWNYTGSAIPVVAMLSPIAAAPTNLLCPGTSWIAAKSSSFVYNSEPARKAQLFNAAAQAMNTPGHMLQAVTGMEGSFKKAEFAGAIGHAMLITGSTIPHPTLAPLSVPDNRTRRSVMVASALLATPIGERALATESEPLTRADVQALRREVHTGNLHRKLASAPLTARASLRATTGTFATLAIHAPAASSPSFARSWNNIVRNPNLLPAFRTEVRRFHLDTLDTSGVDTAANPAWGELIDRMSPGAVGVSASAPARLRALDRPGRPPLYIPPYKPTSVAHSFAIPVSDAATLNISESSQHLSGYGVMVRVGLQRGPSPSVMTPWRCPTLGRIYYYVRAGQVSGMPVVHAAVLPLRPQLSGSGDTMQQTLYFDAAPMSSKHALGDIGAMTPQTAAVNNDVQGVCHADQRQPVLLYQSIYPDPMWVLTEPEKWAQHQPALKFGRVAESAVFAVQNSGALSAGLGLSTAPGELQPYNPSFTPPDCAIHRELYLRRVPVGPVELVPPQNVILPSGKIGNFQPSVSSKSQLVPLDAELDREVIAVPDSIIYYAAAPERALPDESPEALKGTVAPGIGTLDLTGGNTGAGTQDWSLSFDSVDLNKAGDQTLLAVRLEWNDNLSYDPLQPPGYSGSLEVDILRSGTSATATLKFNDQVLASQPVPSLRFDLRLEMTSSVCLVTLAPRKYFFSPEARPAAIQISKDLMTWQPSKRARLRVATLDAGNGIGSSASFRRPRIQFAAQAAVAVPEDRPLQYLLARDYLAVSGTDLNVLSNYSVQVRIPSVDIATWDRWNEWTAADQSLRALRWADYYRQGSKNTARNAMVDDPAITTIEVEAVPVYGTSRSQQWFTPPVTPPSRFCRSQQTVAIKLSTDDPPTTPPDDTLYVLPGEIWELRFYCAVPMVEFDPAGGGRFHPRMRDDLRTHGNNVLFGPLKIRVETATLPAWPAQADVLQANILKSITSTHTVSNVSVSLDRGPIAATLPDPDAFWSQVKQGSLRVQEWRWLGRPLRRSPYDGPPEQALPQWEVNGAFNGRQREDSRVVDSQISLYDQSPLLLQEDISNDLRALYFRYQLTLSARFALLSKSTSDPTVKESTPTAWVREIIPCRRTDQPPKPLVQLVVPLTQSAEWDDNPKPESSPGVLVLVAERAFAFGGFNEMLRFDVLPTRDEEIRVDKTLIELGYDPRLTVASAPNPVIFDPPDGPIGHTLDLAVQTPLYRACSYIIHLPAHIDAKFAPMARLRFWRELDRRGISPMPTTNPVSEKTPPMNVQFLPETVRFFGSSDLSDFSIAVTPGGRGIQFRKGQSIAPIRRTDNADITVLVTVLNRLILDAFGQEQEEFVSLLGQNPSTPSIFDQIIATASSPLNRTILYRARLVELEQVDPNTPTGGDAFRKNAARQSNEATDAWFWRRSFNEQTDDSTLRIMGVSLAIESRPSPTPAPSAGRVN